MNDSSCILKCAGCLAVKYLPTYLSCVMKYDYFFQDKTFHGSEWFNNFSWQTMIKHMSDVFYVFEWSEFEPTRESCNYF